MTTTTQEDRLQMRKLEIGAGDSKQDGWKTSDIRSNLMLDYVCPAWEIHYLEGENYWDNLYACMVLEHVPKGLQLMSLQSWFQALKPGGVLEVIAPNMKYIGTLLSEGNEEGIRLVYGDRQYVEDTHVHGFFLETLVRDLETTGFTILDTNETTQLYVKATK